MDNRTDPAPVQRTISFEQDGPGTISAQLKNVNSGKVRICLRGGGAPPQCLTAHGGTLTRAVFDATPTDWSLSVLGTAPDQHATVTLEFNALSIAIGLDSFRFNGMDDQYNNGFQVVFGVDTAGNLNVQGDIDDGHDTPYPWHLNVSADDATVFDQTGGPSTSVNGATPLSGGSVYAVTLQEPDPTTTGAFPVYLSSFTVSFQ